MSPLLPLDICLAQALGDRKPVAPESLGWDRAPGHVLAADLLLPIDLPGQPQALRAGLAVAALDLVGASAQVPLPLGAVHRVVPGQAMPPGTDAVLPEDAVDWSGPVPEALSPIGPGEGMRRAGHDGRAGQIVARAGARIGALAAFVAAEAGIVAAAVRRPRVRVALETAAHADFAARWAAGLGAIPSDPSSSASASAAVPDLLLRTSNTALPRLALTGGETAWLHAEGATLVLDLPPRFDGMMTGLLALGVPALAMLAGAGARPITRPLLRKAASAPGMSDLVLLMPREGAWHPSPPGLVTLATLAEARAFAILPPESEGLPAGAPLAAQPLGPDLGPDFCEDTP